MKIQLVHVVLILSFSVLGMSCQHNPQKPTHFDHRAREAYLAARNDVQINKVVVWFSSGYGKTSSMEYSLVSDLAWKRIKYNDGQRDKVYVGKHNIMDYSRLCQLIESSAFIHLAPFYDSGVIDGAPIWIRVICSDGIEKHVGGEADVVPDSFWVIMQTVRGITANIVWDEIEYAAE